MRIVFDISTPQQVGGSGRPYSIGPGFQGFRSAIVDIVCAESPAGNHPELPEGMFGSDQAIYIEGDSRYIIQMLEDALVMVRDMEEGMRAHLGEVRSTNCPDECDGIEENNGIHAVDCPRHPNYDPRHPNHAR